MQKTHHYWRILTKCSLRNYPIRVQILIGVHPGEQKSDGVHPSQQRSRIFVEVKILLLNVCWGARWNQFIFSCIRFGKFSLFVLKTANLEVVGNFYPLPCRIGLSLFLSTINPILEPPWLTSISVGLILLIFEIWRPWRGWNTFIHSANRWKIRTISDHLVPWLTKIGFSANYV